MTQRIKIEMFAYVMGILPLADGKMQKRTLNSFEWKQL